MWNRLLIGFCTSEILNAKPNVRQATTFFVHLVVTNS